MKSLENRGIVYLVGAGPGDPALISVKGLEVIRNCQVIVYDNLVDESLLKEAPPSAELIYVGKKAGAHTLPQKQINSLLISLAKSGKSVVRLKGGDPFVFGRGGEEALALARKGICFEVIPGITAGVAAPASAGIPVTHRGLASSVTFITGHEDPEKEASALNWDNLAGEPGTLIFFMGMKNLPIIAGKLMKSGKSPQTPAAVIYKGTTPEQRTVVGCLSDIVEKVRQKDIKPPSVIVIGHVVELRRYIKWYESLPLYGKTIVVTRSRDQASSLVQQLQSLGANVMEFPLIRILPPKNYEPIDEVISSLDKFDWVIFTSVNGVDYFFQRMFQTGIDTRELKGVKIAVVGPATERKLNSYHLFADCMPGKFTSSEILKKLKKHGNLKGKRILLPRSDIADKTLPRELEKAGAHVVEVSMYRTALEKNALKRDLMERIKSDGVDWITFTSSSTVRNFCKIFKGELSELRGKFKTASIGPITSKTLMEYDMKVDVESNEHTISGLVKTILNEEEKGEKVIDE
ncbi:MAG: uroporphyrinogen-III C-methyltransferase [Fidelibacterota bacterium]